MNNNPKTFNNEKPLLTEGFSYIVRALKDGYSLQTIRRQIVAIVNMYCTVLTKTERNEIINAFYGVSRAAYSSPDWRKIIGYRYNYDKVLAPVRRAASRYNMEQKLATTRAQLSEKENIFFFCSEHKNCADDHIDLQGKIFVDKHWRLKVDAADYVAVLYYIKNHRIMTIQEAMGRPHYLTTRPNCRHFFVPLATHTVLSKSRNMIRQGFFKMNFRPYSNGDYFRNRKWVYDTLNLIEPCKWFREKIRR